MKWLIVMILFITQFNTKVDAQLHPVVQLSQKVIKSVLPGQSARNTAVVLTSLELNRIAEFYPSYKTKLTENGSYIYYQGKIYRSKNELLNEVLTPRRYFLDENLKETGLEKSLKQSIETQTYESRSVPIIVEEVKRIQRVLRLLGYQVRIDGDIGNETKTAIEQAFGFSCKGLNTWQICNQILAKQKPKSTPILYKLTIVKTNQEPQTKIVDAKALNNEFLSYKCGIEEMCVNTAEKKMGSIQFSCKDADGTDVVFTITSEKASLELNFKTGDGSSATIGIDSKGNFKVSSSDGNNSRTISSKLR